MFTTSILKQKACDAMGTSIERPFGHINFLESKSRPKIGHLAQIGPKGPEGDKKCAQNVHKNSTLRPKLHFDVQKVATQPHNLAARPRRRQQLAVFMHRARLRLSN